MTPKERIKAFISQILEATEPESVTPEETQQQLNDIRNDVADAGGRNQYFYGQYGLDR